MKDIVSYELAVKLKEKGFPQHITDEAYIVDNYGEDEYDIGDRLPIPLVPDYMDDVAAPTISQVLKWLRDQEISVEPLSTPYNDWKCYVKNKGEIVTMISGDKYKTYEQAALAGIEDVLDNLIENIMEKKRYVASGLSATSNDNLYEQLRQLQLYVP